MSLQKKNPLLRSHMIVGVFWFLVLFFVIHGLNLKRLADVLSYSILVMAGGLTCGVLLWFMFSKARRQSILDDGGAHSLREANCTLGPLPKAKEHARGRARSATIIKRFPAWPEYEKMHPAHARAFMALLGVMESEPKLPASPVPGGHGDVTLIEHSFNVVDMLMKMSPSWSYKGHRNKKGDVSFPLLDSTKLEFRFDKDDPILPLTAFAHDIGKIVCYKLNKDGSVTEVRKNHDIEGAKLMRSIPEVMALPWSEQMALLISCEYYHHIGSLPYSTWIDDRARALIELLIAADIATGKKEGGVIIGEYEHSDIILKQTQAEQEHAAKDETPSNQASTPVADPAKPVTSELNAVYGSPYDLAYSVLLEPSRVNGGNALERVAWKHGEWIYISDFKLRSAVSKKTGDQSYNKLPHRGQMHSFTMGLMAELAERGNLLQEFDGKTYSEKRAIFTTQAVALSKKDKGGKPIETPFVIVAKVKAFPGLGNAADCKNEPKVVRCSWGDTAASNKNGEEVATKPAAKPAQKTEPAPEVKESAIEDEVLPFASWEVEPEQTNGSQDQSEENLDTTMNLTFDLPTDDAEQAPAPVAVEGIANPVEKLKRAQKEVSGADDQISQSEIKLLLELVDARQFPFIERTLKGVDYYLFRQDLLLGEYPGLILNGDSFIRITGGASGNLFIGLRVPS